MQKERALLTEDEIEVSTESVRASAVTVGSIILIPVTRIEIKEAVHFWKSSKRLTGVAGWTRFARICLGHSVTLILLLH